ncbi:MAG: hypothetical protein WBP41_05050 [Saprospiraceae bacterium]
MKTNAFYTFKLICLPYCICICFTSCSDDPVFETKPLVDAEGNEYPIGKMCDGKYWMLNNLAITKFQNLRIGNQVPEITQVDLKHYLVTEELM